MAAAESPPEVTENIVRSILSPVVKILVGKTEIAFHFHSDLLCQASDYFQACLQGNFSEAVKGEVKLRETRADTFQYFVKWLYTGDVAPFDEALTCEDICYLMIDTYALGDRLLCEGLKNRAVDMVQEVCEQSILDAQRMLYAAQTVEPKSLLMQYLIEQLISDMSGSTYGVITAEDAWLQFITLDGRMTTDIMSKLIERQSKNDNATNNDPANVQGCRWHEHADIRDETCDRWPSGKFRP